MRILFVICLHPLSNKPLTEGCTYLVMHSVYDRIGKRRLCDFKQDLNRYGLSHSGFRNNPVWRYANDNDSTTTCDDNTNPSPLAGLI